MAVPRVHSHEDDEEMQLRPIFFYLCFPCICSFRSLVWVWRTIINRDGDGEAVRPFRRLLVYLTFFIICTYIYLTNYAYFCRASHTPRGATRMLIFASPALEGNHKIEREGFLGEFWVAAEDLYLSHVVCSTIESFRPTHVVVLGDIFSYQYLDFQEFARRARRYQSIFNVTACLPARSIKPVLVNVSGNSDIGYGLEMSRSTVSRFEQMFGKVNNEILTPGHSFVVLNSLNLDPSTDQDMRHQTWSLLDAVHERRLQNDLNTVMLQHLPFHRPEEACGETISMRTTKDHFTVEQSHVSQSSSASAINLARPTLVFSSHHPEGCYYEHPGTGAREYTVRSVQSGYGGHAMVLDIYEKQRGTYEYLVTSCSFITMRTFYPIMGLLVAWVSLVSLLIIELIATSAFWARLTAPPSPRSLARAAAASARAATAASNAIAAGAPAARPSVVAAASSWLRSAASSSSNMRKPKSFVRKNV